MPSVSKTRTLCGFSVAISLTVFSVIVIYSTSNPRLRRGAERVSDLSHSARRIAGLRWVVPRGRLGQLPYRLQEASRQSRPFPAVLIQQVCFPLFRESCYGVLERLLDDAWVLSGLDAEDNVITADQAPSGLPIDFAG